MIAIGVAIFKSGMWRERSLKEAVSEIKGSVDKIRENINGLLLS